MKYKITLKMAEEIRQALRDGQSYSAIAREHGLHVSTIARKARGWGMTGRVRVKPGPKRSTPMREHGHHFDRELHCVYCGKKYPAVGTWAEEDWFPCRPCSRSVAMERRANG